MELQSIVCPNCGATTKKKDYCEFCGSFLVGKLVKGVDVSKYADAVRKMPIDSGIKRMLEIFTNIITKISEKHRKLVSLNIVDVRNNNKAIFIVKCTKKNIQLIYPHERFGEFANCSMFSLFEKNTVSFGWDIDGVAKFIYQFINELYPNADTSFVLRISNPYILTYDNEEDGISDEEEDDREDLVEGRYNRNGDFVKGTFYEKWDEDKLDENPEEYDNAIEIPEADFNLQSIEAFLNKEIKDLENIVKDKQKKNLSQKEIQQKLETTLCDKKFVNCVLNLGDFSIGDSIYVCFECSKTSIHIKFFYWGHDLIEFGDFGHIDPFRYLLDSDKNPYYEYGYWHVEKRYILKAADLKRISESQDKDESTLRLRDKWSNPKYIYSERLRKIISVIWQAVEHPSEGMSKLQIACEEKNVYQRNLKKMGSWSSGTLIIWGVGCFLTLIVGGIWSLVVENTEPIIWFAIVTIVLGALCIFKVFGLKSDIKAYESKYGRAFYIH